MSLRINDTIPDLTVETDKGTFSLHDWIGDSWAILFSHPKDFTPVCTTEFGAVAQLADEWEKRGTKVIGVSVDGVPGVRHEHTDHDHNHENCQADCCPAPSTDVFKTVERHVIINGYNFPVLFDLDGLATARLEGSELPVHVLLDANGALARRYTGTRTAAEHDGIARALLGDGTAAAPTAKPADITNPPPDEPRICN